MGAVGNRTAMQCCAEEEGEEFFDRASKPGGAGGRVAACRAAKPPNGLRVARVSVGSKRDSYRSGDDGSPVGSYI